MGNQHARQMLACRFSEAIAQAKAFREIISEQEAAMNKMECNGPDVSSSYLLATRGPASSPPRRLRSSLATSPKRLPSNVGQLATLSPPRLGSVPTVGMARQSSAPCGLHAPTGS